MTDGELKIESRSHSFFDLTANDAAKQNLTLALFDVMVFSCVCHNSLYSIVINVFAVLDSAHAIPGRPRQSRQSPAINSYSTCATWIRGLQMASSLHPEAWKVSPFADLSEDVVTKTSCSL